MDAVHAVASADERSTAARKHVTSLTSQARVQQHPTYVLEDDAAGSLHAHWLPPGHGDGDRMHRLWGGLRQAPQHDAVAPRERQLVDTLLLHCGGFLPAAQTRVAGFMLCDFIMRETIELAMIML